MELPSACEFCPIAWVKYPSACDPYPDATVLSPSACEYIPDAVLLNPCTWENNPDAIEAEPWLKVPCIEVDPVTPKLPVIFVDPVTVKLPVGILTVPNNVWVSLAASPNWLEPEEYCVWLTTNVLIEAVPFKVKLPLNVKFWFNVFK